MIFVQRILLTIAAKPDSLFQVLHGREVLFPEVVDRLQVRLAAANSGFRRPTLWINDVTYAPLIGATGWPAIYDVTDD